jgi:hypothetical protein
LQGGEKVKNRVISISLAVGLILSVGLVGCAGEEVPEILEYNLTVSSTEGGSVTSPGEGTFTYEEGTLIDLVAQPDEGYQFVNWIRDVGTIANVNTASTTITMSGNYSITANFEAILIQYSLAILSTLGGSVTTPGKGTHIYDEGTVVNLVATPARGYKFAKWTGNVDAVANVNAASTNITMNGTYYICANFREEHTCG